ncbi:MAG TPA: hypothetical protein VND93_00075 [Myxococcales bacterium]|nr:hypothetical protein [Myxococcales bacterium]
MKPSDDQLKNMGGTLREIDPSTLQADPEEGAVRWFLGDQGTEIFAWTRDGKPPHHIQLVFARVSVEWNQKTGLMTGTFTATSATAGGRFDPYLLTVGPNVDPDVCRAALRLLSAAPIDEQVVQPLARALEQVVNPVP